MAGDVNAALSDGAVSTGGAGDEVDRIGQLFGQMIDIKAGGARQEGGNLGEGGGAGEGKVGRKLDDDLFASSLEPDGASGQDDLAIDDGAELVDFDFTQGGGLGFAFDDQLPVNGQTLAEDVPEIIN